MATYYLKYRSKNLDELDLTSVRESLKNYLASKDLPHAFLFSGPKGTGKTSAARILAKVINCENRKKGSVNPCNRCDQCVSITRGTNIDVIELDAASHRGIDDVRSLREAVKLAPASASTKVYIVDEAHMLTTEASNALLKTLEEPPDHVVFVLATTNPEKLIGTIRSRTVNVKFSKANTDELVRSLTRVVKGEKLKVDTKTLALIAEASDGSFRDAIKILEQLVLDKVPLNQKNVNLFLKQNLGSSVEDFLKFLAEKKTKEAIDEIEKVISADVSIILFTQKVLDYLRNALLAKVGVGESSSKLFDKPELIMLIESLSETESKSKTSYLEQLPLEIAVIKWCETGKGEDNETDILEEDIELEDNNKDEDEFGMNETKDEVNNESKATNGTSTNGVAQPQNVYEMVSSMTDEVWVKVLAYVKPINASTEALLRAVKPISYEEDTLTLGVFYSFHKERLEDVVHRNIIEDVVGKMMGAKIKIVCRLTKPPIKVAPVSVEETEVNNGSINNSDSSVVLTESPDDDIMKVAEEVFGI